jgi:hypothetical protein
MLLHAWARQPLQVVCLLAVLALITVGRPWSCIAHCMMVDGAHAQHSVPTHATTSHDNQLQSSAAGWIAGFDPCDDEQSPQMAHEEPSPLTIAVILPILLLAQCRPTRASSIRRAIDLRSYLSSPPLRPPTCSSCFTR